MDWDYEIGFDRRTSQSRTENRLIEKKVISFVVFDKIPLQSMKIELSHDILAKKVYEEASAEDKLRLKVEHLVRERYQQYQERKVFMGKEDMEYIHAHLRILDLSEEELAFVELNEKKLQSEKNRKRRIALSIIVALFALLMLTSISWIRSENSKSAQLGMKLALHGFRELDSGKPSLAFRLIQQAYRTKNDSGTLQVIQDVMQDIVESRLKCDLEHQAEITVLDISSDDAFLLTASKDGAVKLWDKECRLIKSFFHRGRVYSGSFSHNARFLLTSAADSTAVFRDLSTGDSIVIPHPAPVRFSRFSPNDELFLTGCDDHRVRLFDLEGNLIAPKTIQLSDSIISAEFSPASNFMMAASKAAIRLKDIQILEINALDDTISMNKAIKMAHFVPFEQLFVAFEESGGQVMDNSGGPTYHYQYLNDNIDDTDNITGFAMDIHPLTNAPEVIFTTTDSICFVKKWSHGKRDSITKRPITILDYVISSTTPSQYAGIFSSKNKILICSEEQQVEIRNKTTGNVSHKFKSAIYLADYAHQDSFLLTTAGDRIAHIWNASVDSNLLRMDLEKQMVYYDSNLANISSLILRPYFAK